MRATCNRQRQRGITLIECLVYFSLLLVVMGLAYSAYCRCLDNSRRLQRNAADIVLSLNAGERWRDDVRLSRGFTISADCLVLTQAAGCVEYTFSKNAVWRDSVRLIAHVKNSSMQRDNYQRVPALRWELELESSRPDARVKPLFTFKAAPTLQQP